VGVLFQRGAFDAADTVRVAWVLAAFAPGIWAYQSVHILSRAFYAMKLPMRPLRIALAMVALNLALNLTLIFTPLRESGLAWSTSICAALQAILLCRSLSREVPGILDRELRGGALRTAIATAAMTLAVVAVSRVLPTGLVPSEMLLSLAVKISIGAAVFALSARLLRMPELGWTIGRRGGEQR
jgi:putative peptidoglycan lipid II flippase